MKQWLLLFFAFLPMALSAQKKSDDLYAREWQQADSLLQQGLPESAAKIAARIYEKAREKGEEVQMMKAQIYNIRSSFQWEENAFAKNISEVDSLAANSTFPANAIWKSISAELYWNYYQQYRWQIMQRTKVVSSAPIQDFEQWDAARFFDKIQEQYLASLKNTGLTAIPIDKYESILIKGVHTERMRPTLYDFLAFRALTYFENEEKDITRPAFSFVMNDTMAFAPTAVFASYTFETKDKESLQWRALKTYQHLLKIHDQDADKTALLDADLQRLAFVYRASVSANKKELYKNALQHLADQYAAHPLAASSLVAVAQLSMDVTATRYNRFTTTEKKNIHYPEIKKQLEYIIGHYPGSEGAVQSKGLLQQITSKDLRLTAEEVVLPQEVSRVLINYKNIGTAWLRLVKIQAKDYPEYYRGDNYGSPDLNTRLLALATQKQWSVTLPGIEDYETHSTEIKIDALSCGQYALMISNDKSFAGDGVMSYVVFFQVSGITAIQNNEKGYALNRKTGDPKPNLSIAFYQRGNDGKLRITNTTQSENNGSFSYDKKNQWVEITRITGDHDTVFVSGFNVYNNYGGTRQETKTFFFTDRSIYRPGQTLFFKGIVLKSSDGSRKNEVLNNYTTEAIFYDVNHQKIASKKFTTNEYGSFNGSFIIPQGGLTGYMSLQNEHGSTSFSVEEYKRPKFSILFDTIKQAYALNEKVTIGGKAMAFAGNAIDGAIVNYRVVRNVRYPFWWCAYRWGFPQSPEMEIINGKAVTGKDGSFSIDFMALPDPGVNKESLPVFSYTVTADVTDVNGETRSNSTTIQAGYTSIQLAVNIPAKARPSQLTDLQITTTNLNDQYVANVLDIHISRLKAPQQVLRKRLWETPDQFLMGEAEFKKYFPGDVYRDEDKAENWEKANEVWSNHLKSSKEGIVRVPETAWKENGWYVVEIATKDKNGQELVEKKYLQVWDEANKGNPTDPLFIAPEALTLEPVNTATVRVASAYPHLSILQMTQAANENALVNRGEIHNDLYTYTHKITEADRGGRIVQFITVKENRVYAGTAYITVPWSNKDLDISWKTHRDKLLPGEKEKWTMVIKGHQKEKISAEMVATLYDASLDQLKSHQWPISGIYPSLYSYNNWRSLSQGIQQGITLFYNQQYESAYYEKQYDQLLQLSSIQNSLRGDFETSMVKDDNPRARSYKHPVSALASLAGGTYQEKNISSQSFAPAPEATAAKYGDSNGGVISHTDQNAIITPRKNLQETAFFFPDLHTDAEGNILLDFTMPEALTEWKLMAFAHTKDMSYGSLQGKIKTQKDLMVMPNLPRFLRQGDAIAITTKISNLSDKELAGTASVEFLNALTLQPITTAFRIKATEKSFTIGKSQSTAVSWTVQVPESIYEPVTVRVTARSGNFSDGEENTIPVVTNRMLVTETLPLWMNGNGSKTFYLDKLKHSDSNKTIVQHALTVEYTANPAWYVVQSLPYLIEYPYECAEQTFNRYYATALAAHIIDQTPKIKAIFESWKNESALSGFVSPLARNEELKSALLEETPWVMDAQNETEQRKRISQLFDTYRLSKELQATAHKLKDMQLSNGAFGWFNGMYADRYITQYIVTGIGRLQQLGVKDRKGWMNDIAEKAITYLDNITQQSYDELLRNKAKLSEQHISEYEVQYLYMRSFFNKPLPSNNTAYTFYQQQAVKYWPKFNPSGKGMIALSLYRTGDKATPAHILQSLKETAVYKEEMGMYWPLQTRNYWWYEAPVEMQALLISCFEETAQDEQSVERMKRWLLKNKQTNSWATTKATADACYALLATGKDWLNTTPEVSIGLGGLSVSGNVADRQAGTGYFKKSIFGNEIKKDMGNITLSVNNARAQSPSWGAVYWQYFEDLNNISGAENNLQVKKQLFITRNTASGPELSPVTPDNPLQVGDKVTVRIEIITDRDMEFVHLKDMRAACFEPVSVLSGYKWQNGLGYYESTRDVSTNFFFDHLRKGKYVFEYPVYVSQKGTFSNGIATLQCMYAPEFNSHSAGLTVTVQE